MNEKRLLYERINQNITSHASGGLDSRILVSASIDFLHTVCLSTDSHSHLPEFYPVEWLDASGLGRFTELGSALFGRGDRACITIDV